MDKYNLCVRPKMDLKRKYNHKTTHNEYIKTNETKYTQCMYKTLNEQLCNGTS